MVSSKDAEKAVDIKKNIQVMRAREIKKELESVGVDCSGIFDKDELVVRLVDYRIAKGEKTSPDQPYAANINVGVHVPLQVLRGSFGNPKNYITCTVTISGHDETFIIDTGSSNCIVTSQLCTKHNLQKITETTTTGAGGGGGVFNAPVFGLKNVVVGGQNCNLQAIAIPGNSLPPGISGLIGIDFIKNFDVADFNFKNNDLHLHNSAEVLKHAVSNDNLVQIPLIPHPLGLVCCSLELNQRSSLAAIIDMGSTFSIVNLVAAQQAGISSSSDSSYEYGVALMTGVDGRPMKVDRAQFASAKLGGVLGLELKGPKIHIGDIPGLSQVGWGSGPGGLIGLDILGGTRSVFDFKNMNIFIVKNS